MEIKNNPWKGLNEIEPKRYKCYNGLIDKKKGRTCERFNYKLHNFFCVVDLRTAYENKINNFNKK